jgi:hypothetical protein
MKQSLLYLLSFIFCSTAFAQYPVYDFSKIHGEIDFSKAVLPWDGFGFNYVEIAQTDDPFKVPQDLGGFTILSEKQKQEIINFIFGEDGLKVSIVKMFLDPFHQKQDGSFDHVSTNPNMLYFVREGLKKTRAGGRDLSIITTLYGPPAFAMKLKKVRTRDFDITQKDPLVNYMVDWVKYLKTIEQFPVKYLSLHNEGEEYVRWSLKGDTPEVWNHDYNMFWPHEMINEFLIKVPKALKKAGIKDVGVTPGETSNWERFYRWGYADKIADNKEALNSIALITSHGFMGLGYGRWHSMHVSTANDIFRDKRPDLHSWVTSTSWARMDAVFVRQLFSNIYFSRSNAIIPWAGIQRLSHWWGGNPNAGSAIVVKEDSTYELRRGYYYYKQATRAGQPGMNVCRAWIMDSELAIMAFAKEKTNNPDAFIVINVGEKEKTISLNLMGTRSTSFDAFRTNDKNDNEAGVERYKSVGVVTTNNNTLIYTVPPASVTTFFGK